MFIPSACAAPKVVPCMILSRFHYRLVTTTYQQHQLSHTKMQKMNKLCSRFKRCFNCKKYAYLILKRGGTKIASMNKQNIWSIEAPLLVSHLEQCLRQLHPPPYDKQTMVNGMDIPAPMVRRRSTIINILPKISEVHHLKSYLPYAKIDSNKNGITSR